MAYDKATNDFMDSVSDKDRPKQIAASALRKAVSIVRAVEGENPKAALGGLVFKQGISALTKSIAGDKLASDEIHKIDVISIYKQLNDKYDRGWWDWEPETVVQTLQHDYGIDLHEDGTNVVGALQLILKTNQAHENWHVFEKVGHAFNTNIVDFSELQPLRPDEIAYLCEVLGRIRPQEQLSTEVCAYIAACARNSGVVFLPEEFFPKSAQGYLDELNNDLQLKARVESLWKSGVKESQDAAEDVQLKSLQEIVEYRDKGVGRWALQKL